MKKLAVVVLSVGVAVALMASAAVAGPWGGRFYGMGPMASNLTPEQSSKILALQQAHLETVTPLQESLFKKKMELRSLWVTQNPDQATINALQKEVFELVDQLQQTSIKHRGEMLKVINP